MSFTLHGIGVTSGIAIGRAQLVSHATLEVAHYILPEHDIPHEVVRFENAVKAVQNEIQGLHQTMVDSAPAEFGAFLDLHWMILSDHTLSEIPKQLIASQRCNAEWALTQQMQTLLDQFDQIEDSYLRERKTDVIHVVERVMKVLLGHPGHFVPANAEQTILVAHDLSPADVIQFKRQPFAAFITDVGGATSHTTILARSLNIPSVVALHHARELIRDNEVLIVDGTQDVIIVNPDEQILAEYKLRQRQLDLERLKLKRLKTTKTLTLDGTPIELQANIELPSDVEQAKENGASGVGLFRTEFLFLNRDTLPSEDEQFEAYKRVVDVMGQLPVTIRTFDLGADKHLEGLNRVTPNPALGLRAIRLCLTEPQLFLTQLRALLRASHYGNIRILIPMLSTLAEINQTLLIINHAKETLADQKIPFNDKIAIGGMIEIPAAALSLQVFIRKLNFLSIGTNDLIQYTLAIDRSDEMVSYLYDPFHPAILYLISNTIRMATKAKVPISICGEVAGEVAFTRLLLGFGLRQFSMHPAQLLAIKQQVLKASIPEIEGLTHKLARLDEPEKLREIIHKINKLEFKGK
jgi:phosphotransferase system enzyme I (PtsI)